MPAGVPACGHPSHLCLSLSDHLCPTPAPCRYLIIYVTEGCRPQNRLYYLDLDLVPKHPDTNTLDFSTFDFLKGGYAHTYSAVDPCDRACVVFGSASHVPGLQCPAWQEGVVKKGVLCSCLGAVCQAPCPSLGVS